MESQIQKYKKLKFDQYISKTKFQFCKFNKDCLKYVTEVQKASLDKCGSESTNKYFFI